MEQQSYLAENEDNAEPSREVLERWKAIFLQCLHGAEPAELEAKTRGQATSDDLFLERICRLTASRCKLVCTRQREFKSLCRQLLYTSPPTHLPALEYGRRKEPEAVQQYSTMYPERQVSESGLVVKENAKFIAATPDRLISDPQATPQEGLMEVKCPFATTDTPSVTATKKKGFCLKSVNGTITLDRRHQYFYQVRAKIFMWMFQSAQHYTHIVFFFFNFSHKAHLAKRWQVTHGVFLFPSLCQRKEGLRQSALPQLNVFSAFHFLLAGPVSTRLHSTPVGRFCRVLRK